MNKSFGTAIKQATIDNNFLTGMGEDLVPKLLLQMTSIPGFINLFGPYKPGSNQQRWTDHQRQDWSLRELPAINVFEAKEERKESDNAYVNGTVSMQIFWPPSARRSDVRQYEVAFKGAIDNFFSSQYAYSMLDEFYAHVRPQKVNGLNEFGRRYEWLPNTEGIIADENVPVTYLNIEYRLDKRAWYRSLEYQSRTQADPFDANLAPLNLIEGVYNAQDEKGATQFQLQDAIPITQD